MWNNRYPMTAHLQGAFALELTGLVRAIETDTTPPVDARWGRYIVAVALGV